MPTGLTTHVNARRTGRGKPAEIFLEERRAWTKRRRRRRSRPPFVGAGRQFGRPLGATGGPGVRPVGDSQIQNYRLGKPGHRPASFSEAVPHPRGPRVDDLPADHADLFELLELDRENASADAAESSPKVFETGRGGSMQGKKEVTGPLPEDGPDKVEVRLLLLGGGSDGLEAVVNLFNEPNGRLSKPPERRLDLVVRTGRGGGRAPGHGARVHVLARTLHDRGHIC
jgi:hypothetical protein